MELEPGTSIGGNVLVERIGPHGGAEVWRARNSGGLNVTLRVGALRGRSPEAVAAQLEGDLAIASRAHHPNIVRVLGAGVEGGLYYVVSEPVDGLLLRALLERARSQGPWPDPYLAGYVAHQLSNALAAVHEIPGPDGEPLGALHRELTPDGVLLARDGRVKLAELVSSLDSQDLVETASRASRGAVAYVSPEAVSQKDKDARSDVFAVGAIFWELLTGRAPFLRDSDLATLEAVRTADIPPMAPGVPVELARIAERCIQKRPADRYGSPADIVTALEVVLEGQTGAGPRALADLLRSLDGAPAAARPRTAMLSEASQAPRTMAETSERTLADPPPPTSPASDQPERRSGEAGDDFYDPVRDGGGLDNPRFEVLGRLGSGAMGQVYRVRDLELDEVVALKRIPPEMSDSRQVLERLKREVRIARRIASDHVCRIFDIVDLGGGERGLTMAVVDGTTLADLMQRSLQTDYRRIARWGADIADGLAAAHNLNIVHRDLKPENIMIRSEDDRAVVLDFGIARPLDDAPEDVKLTQAGIIMGTPLYMSPEQLVNGPLDGRSDLYGLGLILAELATGTVPLSGRSYAEILDRRVRQNETYSLGAVAPGVPHALAELIDRTLGQAAAHRPETAAEVKAALEAWLDGRASPASVPGAAPTPSAPHPAPAPVAPPSTPATPVPSTAPGESAMATDAAGTTFASGLADQAAARDPWRYITPIILLAVIALVLGFWVFQNQAQVRGGDRLSATRGATDAGAIVAADAGAAPATAETPDTGVASPPAVPPAKPDAGKRRIRRPPRLPPAEEM